MTFPSACCCFLLTLQCLTRTSFQFTLLLLLVLLVGADLQYLATPQPNAKTLDQGSHMCIAPKAFIFDRTTTVYRLCCYRRDQPRATLCQPGVVVAGHFRAPAPVRLDHWRAVSLFVFLRPHFYRGVMSRRLLW